MKGSRNSEVEMRNAENKMKGGRIKVKGNSIGQSVSIADFGALILSKN